MYVVQFTVQGVFRIFPVENNYLNIISNIYILYSTVGRSIADIYDPR